MEHPTQPGQNKRGGLFPEKETVPLWSSTESKRLLFQQTHFPGPFYCPFSGVRHGLAWAISPFLYVVNQYTYLWRIRPKDFGKTNNGAHSESCNETDFKKSPVGVICEHFIPIFKHGFQNNFGDPVPENV